VTSLTRRGFLRRAGLAGAAAAAGAAAPGLLAACSARPDMGPPLEGDLHVPPPGTGGGPTLVYRGWNYKVDIVQQYLSRFTDHYREKVDYQTVTGDYGSIITKMAINREPLNFQYANPDTAARWYIADWLYDYSHWWDVDAATADMYPGFRDVATVRGKLVGLPYFQSVRGTIVTNERILRRAGIDTSSYPKTWDELYEHVYHLKKIGAADTPFLPHWFATIWYGISWGFLFECQNRGAVVFDDKGNPVFDHKTYAILDQWRKLLVDGVVPRSVFTMQESDFINAFASGAYAYSPQQIYDSKTFNDPSTSKIAGKSKYVKVDGQPWGLIDTGLYTVSKRAKQSRRTIERAFRLAGYYGFRDWTGALYTAKSWAITNALNSGYQSILKDPDVVAAYRKWMPDYAYMFPAMEGLLQAARSPNVWHRYFYDEWNSEALTTLSQAVLGQKGTKQALDELKELAEKLVDKYKKVDPAP
jgi:multiple sugar transport system substrate-binding protein